MIKEKAVADGLVPDVKIIKADGMRYGFVDFKSAGHVLETKELQERLWLLSDEEQFKWLDNAIGGRLEGMTWHGIKLKYRVKWSWFHLEYTILRFTMVEGRLECRPMFLDSKLKKEVKT
ncbi:hypothetical protein [Niallia sp. FSL R7-0648]|uniref:hypothetical protein n=1 Tax=Niallia sp. FSL R7-0648 TaxID=2954521 RepID=UPI004046BCC9